MGLYKKKEKINVGNEKHGAKKNKIEMTLRSKSQKIDGAFKIEKKINAGNMEQSKKKKQD